MKAVWNGKVIAETKTPVQVDGYYYFPEEDIKREYLKESATKSQCYWKGQASYYDVVVDGKINKDAAWYYPSPSKAASHIKDHIGFWMGVEIVS